MKEETKLGSTKAHHEEVGVVPRDKAASKTDEPGFGACDEDMSGCDSMMAEGAGCVVTCSWSEAI